MMQRDSHRFPRHPHIAHVQADMNSAKYANHHQRLWEKQQPHTSNYAAYRDPGAFTGGSKLGQSLLQQSWSDGSSGHKLGISSATASFDSSVSRSSSTVMDCIPRRMSVPAQMMSSGNNRTVDGTFAAGGGGGFSTPQQQISHRRRNSTSSMTQQNDVSSFAPRADLQYGPPGGVRNFASTPPQQLQRHANLTRSSSFSEVHQKQRAMPHASGRGGMVAQVGAFSNPATEPQISTRQLPPTSISRARGGPSSSVANMINRGRLAHNSPPLQQQSIPADICTAAPVSYEPSSALHPNDQQLATTTSERISINKAHTTTTAHAHHHPSHHHHHHRRMSKKEAAMAARRRRYSVEALDFTTLPGRDVPTFLRHIRLHKYTEVLQRSQVTFPELLAIDDRGLERAGIQAVGARTRLLKAIERYHEYCQTFNINPLSDSGSLRGVQGNSSRVHGRGGMAAAHGSGGGKRHHKGDKQSTRNRQQGNSNKRQQNPGKGARVVPADDGNAAHVSHHARGTSAQGTHAATATLDNNANNHINVSNAWSTGDNISISSTDTWPAPFSWSPGASSAEFDEPSTPAVTDVTHAPTYRHHQHHHQGADDTGIDDLISNVNEAAEQLLDMVDTSESLALSFERMSIWGSGPSTLNNNSRSTRATTRTPPTTVDPFGNIITAPVVVSRHHISSSKQSTLVAAHTATTITHAAYAQQSERAYTHTQQRWGSHHEESDSEDAHMYGRHYHHTAQWSTVDSHADFQRAIYSATGTVPVL